MDVTIVRSQVKPATKELTFFSIDQILGKKYNLDDDVFEKESSCETGAFECMSKDEEDKPEKSVPSYTAIIAQAILNSGEQKLPLGCIYDYIAKHFPDFLKKGQGWRNCVRHNLSLSECFVKAGRARNGRGNYWGIHPRYIKNFSKGDYRKRRASHRPRNQTLLLSKEYQHYYQHNINPYLHKNGFNEQAFVNRRSFSMDTILQGYARNATTGYGFYGNENAFQPYQPLAGIHRNGLDSKLCPLMCSCQGFNKRNIR